MRAFAPSLSLSLSFSHTHHNLSTTTKNNKNGIPYLKSVELNPKSLPLQIPHSLTRCWLKMTHRLQSHNGLKTPPLGNSNTRSGRPVRVSQTTFGRCQLQAYFNTHATLHPIFNHKALLFCHSHRRSRRPNYWLRGPRITVRVEYLQ